MGPWRALMGRARGRPRYLSPSSASHSSPPSSSSASLAFSSLSLAKAEQYQPCPLDPIACARLSESHEACARLRERLWPGLGSVLPNPIYAQKNARPNVDGLLEDAKDFLLDSSSNEGLGSPSKRLSEGFLQVLEKKNTWVIAKSSLVGFPKQSAPKHAEDVSLRFSMCDSAIRAPGFCGLEDFVIRADSVKRKRKKKMNKHKHRKLRRLARKSRK